MSKLFSFRRNPFLMAAERIQGVVPTDGVILDLEKGRSVHLRNGRLNPVDKGKSRVSSAARTSSREAELALQRAWRAATQPFRRPL